MTFTGSTPREELYRQIREAFSLWNQRKARMTTLLGHHSSSKQSTISIGKMTLPQCTAAVVANPQEGIYA